MNITIRLASTAALVLAVAACAPRTETVRTSTVETSAPALAPTTTTTQSTWVDPYSGNSKTVTSEQSGYSADKTVTERTTTTKKWP